MIVRRVEPQRTGKLENPRPEADRDLLRQPGGAVDERLQRDAGCDVGRRDVDGAAPGRPLRQRHQIVEKLAAVVDLSARAS